jgi:hypothetical protein
MSTSSARVPTANASKYMTQLCKHWSHKFETMIDGDTAHVELPGGRVSFDAGTQTLTITISPKSDETLDRMKGVVETHLDRFAFREAPLTYHWS